jgi:cell division protein ZapA (FtsZ GTPase activity inhibitor)
MSNQLKIKLSIADRVYPLTIHPNQEEGLRKAAKKIENMIKKFENSYAVRDKQDVLAMSALQFAAQVEQKNIETIEGGETIVQKIQALNDLLQHQLT